MAFRPSLSLSASLVRRSKQAALRQALQPLSLALESGERLAVMGSNGAGKTTLLRILARLILPSGGTIEYQAFDRSAVGFVPADQKGLYARLTGRENLLFFAALYGLHGKTAHKHISALIEMLDVEAPDQHYQEYSSGMKQRLALARALLADPKLLLLDEPSRSLDPAQTAKLHARLKDWAGANAGRMLVFATHSAAEAEALAQKLLVLHHGRTELYDKIASIRERGPLQTTVEALCAQR